MKQLSYLVLAGFFLAAQTTHAQFIGGAAPAGAPYQIYAVPGVAQGGSLATVFTCTNGSGDMADVAVQLFNHNGAAMNASPALTIPPGGTAQFATAAAAPFTADQYLSPVGSFSKGSAKIWSSSKKLLLCGAFLVGNFGTGYTFGSLTIVSKVKQKGD